MCVCDFFGILKSYLGNGLAQVHSNDLEFDLYMDFFFQKGDNTVFASIDAHSHIIHYSKFS